MLVYDEKYLETNSVSIVSEPCYYREYGFSDYFESKINCIAKLGEAIKENYVLICLYLDDIKGQETDLKKANCKDIYEFAERFFGFGKTTTKNMLRIKKEFIGGGGILKPTFQKYSYSQLTELASIDDLDTSEFTPDMTVKEIREKKKELKSSTKADSNQINIEETIYGQTSDQSDEARISDNLIITKDRTYLIVEPCSVGGQYTEHNKTKEYLSKITVEGLMFNTFINTNGEYVAFLLEGQKVKTLLGQTSDQQPPPPELVPLDNKKQREAFLQTWKDWKIIATIKELNVTVRQFDLSNGAKLYSTTWQSWSDWRKTFYESQRFCLVVAPGETPEHIQSTGTTTCCKSFDLEGTAPTYILDYLTKNRETILIDSDLKEKINTLIKRG